jgi:hypothetical protein
MTGNGQHIRALSNNAVSEASPVMLPDGRILYHRWEYIDKAAGNVKCLWAMRPDGTASAEAHNNTRPLKAIPEHENLSLTQAEFNKIVNWLDAGCQYHPSYWGRKNLRHKDHPDFRPAVTFREAIGTRLPGGLAAR